MKSIGMIGIGAMGNGIAKNLMNAGHSLSVYRRNTASSAAAAEELNSLGASVYTDMKALFSASEILVVCVPASKDVEEILIGQNSLLEANGSTVKTVLDFSTSHPDSTKKIAALLEAKAIELLDTPMTGSVREAANGTLKLIVGGKRSVFEKHRELLASVSELVLYAGGHGSGNLVKLANNYLSILDQAATSGVSIILERNKIPTEVYTEYLGKSSANSGGFRLMMNRISTGDFTRKFELGLALKDIGYCKDFFRLPVTDILYDLLQGASDAGYKDQDIGTVHFYLEKIL
jgi:3-hydroxyisobutyrate dehydrogenase-like beta-hydroxyacid dehydrogenase